MKKLILAASLVTFASLGLAATGASAKGFHGHGHGGWGHGHGHHHHFHGGGWGYGGGYGYRMAYIPRCRLVPGYVGWVRVCR